MAVLCFGTLCAAIVLFPVCFLLGIRNSTCHPLRSILSILNFGRSNDENRKIRADPTTIL